MRRSARQQATEVEVGGGQLGFVERGLAAAGIQLLARHQGDAQPEIGQGHVAGEHQVVHRGGAHFVGILHRRQAHLLGQFAPLRVQRRQLRDLSLQLRMLGLGLAQLVDQFGETAQQLALAAQYLAAEQVEGLDAVGAFVDLCDAAIADQLLHAPLADVAVAAVDLHAEVGHLLPGLGHEGLADRCQEGQQVGGPLALGGVLRQVLGVEQLGGEVGQRAVAFVERLHGQQHAPHVGVHDDRVGRLVRRLRPGQRAHLQALPGVAHGALVTGLAKAQALHAGAQAGVVHHGEHAVQALVRLADQVAGGAVEVHHTGGRGLDPHLVLDGATGDLRRREGTSAR